MAGGMRSDFEIPAKLPRECVAVAPYGYFGSDKLTIVQWVGHTVQERLQFCTFLMFLFRIKGLNVVMDSKEWDILRVMGGGAEDGAIKWRVYDFSSARDVCEAIGCDLSDFACHLCFFYIACSSEHVTSLVTHSGGQ